jgi:hypothetical protein
MLYEHVRTELRAVGRLPIVIPELAWDEAVKGKHGPGRQAFMTAIAGAPTSWDAASAENQLFIRMFAGKEADLGDGERAGIAYACVRTDTVFVTLDKLAMRRAVEHLRGRVLTAFGLLDAWVASNVIPAVILATFAKRYAASGASKDHPAPLWLPTAT